MLASTKTLLRLAPLILLASCAAAGGGDFCLTARPIYVAAGDRFEDSTARAILAHNETGARLCGWRPVTE